MLDLRWRDLAARALVVLVVGSWVGSVAGWLGSAHWVLELASHFGPHAGVAALVAGVALVVARRFAWAGAALVLAAAHGVMAAPLWLDRDGSREAASDRAALRVMVMNVAHYSDDREAVAAAVRAQRPDVVGLVETTPAWDEAMVRALPEYPHAIREPRAGAAGLILLGRAPWSRHEAVLAAGRPTLRAEVETPAGRLVLLLAHPPPPITASRARSRDALLHELGALASAAGPAVVVMGDLNCTTSSPRLRSMLRAGGLRDSRRGLGPQPSWPEPLPVLAIDHVLVGERVRVLARRTVGGLGSDHRAVVADLALAAP